MVRLNYFLSHDTLNHVFGSISFDCILRSHNTLSHVLVIPAALPLPAIHIFIYRIIAKFLRPFPKPNSSSSL